LEERRPVKDATGAEPCERAERRGRPAEPTEVAQVVVEAEGRPDARRERGEHLGLVGIVAGRAEDAAARRRGADLEPVDAPGPERLGANEDRPAAVAPAARGELEVSMRQDRCPE